MCGARTASNSETSALVRAGPLHMIHNKHRDHSSSRFQFNSQLVPNGLEEGFSCGTAILEQRLVRRRGLQSKVPQPAQPGLIHNATCDVSSAPDCNAHKLCDGGHGGGAGTIEDHAIFG